MITMMLSIFGVILLFYSLSIFTIFLFNFLYILDFFKYTAPTEISVFKKEFNIHNKVFDILVITIFILALPIIYFKIRKEC